MDVLDEDLLDVTPLRMIPGDVQGSSSMAGAKQDISFDKRKVVKKSSNRVAAEHLEKWRFVTQRRVAVERELRKETVEVKEVMELIKAAGLMKTVTALPHWYEGLVKEFIVNIPKESYEVCKVVVRAGQVKEWPSRKHLSASKLTIKHASTNAVKSPIAFPSIICGIILSQHPGILRASDIPRRRKTPLSIQYKLFEGSHVNDIVMTSAKREPIAKGSLIDQLKETCKELDNGIKLAKARKEALEVFICSMEKEEVEKAEKDSESNSQSNGSSGSSEGSEGTGEDTSEGEDNSSSSD
ncbi:uncharacterized protein LOC127101836 [Lathyrus oleraceus]|uniref:uncharacterized protein LOC127101836 n=1 Tax=Pisum sativum TaxID=3888 RepID=UPI0021CF0FEC|nr:uncharacterized protein LOC127101836 [Pisum sativum]